MRKSLPHFARVNRSLATRGHAFLAVLPGVAASPALTRIAPEPAARARLVERAVVHVRSDRGYAFIDVEVPCIVLAEGYLREG